MSTQVTMSIDLIYQALYEALNLSDASLQIWMTFTFGLIAAAHLAGDRVGGRTYRLVAGLYALYAATLVVRYFSAAYQILYYQGLLLERGFEPWPVPKPVGVLIGSGTFVLMVGGTIGTLWFVRNIRKEQADRAAQIA